MGTSVDHTVNWTEGSVGGGKMPGALTNLQSVSSSRFY